MSTAAGVATRYRRAWRNFEMGSSHEDDFARRGISELDIPDAVMAAVTREKIVGHQGSASGRPIYEVFYNGKVQRIAVSVGDNGFIVGANPAK